MILQEDGILNWALGPLGLSGPGFGNVATWIVFSYLWLPYMILPIYAGLDRLPDSLVDASGDLGARSVRTFFSVVLPLAMPAVIAGSIALVASRAQALRSESGAQAVADASALQQFDSSALAVLLDCRREAFALGKTFAVAGLPPRLRELAGVYGVAELLTPASA